MSFDRRGIPFHMVTCPKRIVQCGVPGCLDVIRQSEMVVHNRDNARKHLDLYAIDEQTKAWSLKEVRILLLTIVNQFTYHTADRMDSFTTNILERKFARKNLDVQCKLRIFFGS